MVADIEASGTVVPLMKRSILKSHSGSSLISILVAVALLGLMGSAAMRMSEQVSKEAVWARNEENVANLSQAVQTLVSNPVVCLSGADGVLGPQNGLRFVDAAGAIVAFDSAQALSANGQMVSLGTNFGPTANLTLVTKTPNLSLDDYGFSLARFYLTATVDTSKANTYHGQLRAKLVPLAHASSLPQMSDKTLADVLLEIDPVTKAIVKCGADQSVLTASSVCATMGCTFSGSACRCPLPEVSCSGGSYISGLDPKTLQPSCTTISIVCPDGQFMSGVDSMGHPVCASVL